MLLYTDFHCPQWTKRNWGRPVMKDHAHQQLHHCASHHSFGHLRYLRVASAPHAIVIVAHIFTSYLSEFQPVPCQSSVWLALSLPVQAGLPLGHQSSFYLRSQIVFVNTLQSIASQKRNVTIRVQMNGPKLENIDLSRSLSQRAVEDQIAHKSQSPSLESSDLDGSSNNKVAVCHMMQHSFL
jgi:hypothetical protein